MSESQQRKIAEQLRKELAATTASHAELAWECRQFAESLLAVTKHRDTLQSAVGAFLTSCDVPASDFAEINGAIQRLRRAVE
jgi:hypothetical protein